MYLLEGKPAPDHATFARFISLHFAQCSKKTLAEVSKLLYSLGEISGKSIFIDGTKIESAANNILLSGKRRLQKTRQNFSIRSLSLWENGENFMVSGSLITGKSPSHLKRLRKKLYRIRREEGIVFVHGSGQRKTRLQKSIENPGDLPHETERIQ